MQESQLKRKSGATGNTKMYIFFLMWLSALSEIELINIKQELDLLV